MRSILSFICIIIVFSSGNTFANGNIFFPDPEILGTDIIGKISTLSGRITPKENVYPKSIHFDIENNIVVGIVAIYDKSINFNEVERVINTYYKDWAYDSFEDTLADLKRWRVTPRKYLIALSINNRNNGDIELIFLRVQKKEK